MLSKPWQGRLLALVACLICDLVAPSILGRNDGGILSFVMLIANMGGLLAAPLLLLLFLGGRLRWVAAAALTQLILGLVTFLGGAQPLHALYLTVLGRPVEATVADTIRECGEQAHGQDAATSYVCTNFLKLEGPSGDEVGGGAMMGSEFVGARLEAVRTDGDPAESIVVLEDPLGLLRPLPADPRTGWPMVSTAKHVHAVVLVICWIMFLGTLAVAVVTSRGQRPRVESTSEDGAALDP